MHALLTNAHDRIQERWQILRNLDVMSGLVEGLSGLVSRWASSSSGRASFVETSDILFESVSEADAMVRRCPLSRSFPVGMPLDCSSRPSRDALPF